MKTYLYDYTNFGVLYVSPQADAKTKWDFSIMRSCILDTNVGRVFANSPSYAAFNNDALRDKFFIVDRNNGVSPGKNESINSIFLEKKRKAQLIAPVVKLLTECIYRRSFNGVNEFGLQIEDTLAFAVHDCDLEKNIFSRGVVEYANTLNISYAEAYEELKMEYETIHSIKMRSYAAAKKFQNMIREISTVEDAREVTQEIEQKLFNETFI